MVLNNLYRHTALQSSFGMNLLAISQNRPRLFSLLGMLREFLQFRRQVVRRRTRFELDRAEQRMHILEGLAAAVDRLDEVIEWIRRSKDPASARARLMRELQPRRLRTDRELLVRAGNGRAEPAGEGLSEAQAQAILDLRLQRLTQMERERIEAEMAELGEKIHDLRDLLQSPERVDGIIRDEAQGRREETRERPPHRDRGGRGRPLHRGVDPGRGHRDLGDPGRLHQADPAQRLPCPVPRRHRALRRWHPLGRCDPRCPDRKHPQPVPVPDG